MQNLFFNGAKLFVLTILTIQCGSQNTKFVSKVDFKITDAYLQHYVGGQPGVAGENVVIEVFNNASVTPDSIYYKNSVSPVEIRKTSENMLWIGRFKNPITQDKFSLGKPKDISNSTNIRKFDLSENEIVIQFTQNQQKRFYKIKNIPTKDPLYMP